MKNNNIDRIVNLTKDQFKTKITDYLTWQVANCTVALDKDHQDKYSAHGQHILKLLLTSRLSALNDLDHKPESEYTNNDWAQCVNITNIFYVMATKEPSRISPRIVKAHFNYCCRYYLKTAPKGQQDHCLQVIHDINEWNHYPLAELNAARSAMNKK